MFDLLLGSYLVSLGFSCVRDRGVGNSGFCPVVHSKNCIRGSCDVAYSVLQQWRNWNRLDLWGRGILLASGFGEPILGQRSMMDGKPESPVVWVKVID